MPAVTVARWLGLTCKELREGAGLRHVHVAAEANCDQSTIVRFEAGAGRGFPRDLDTILGAYAKTVGIAESEIWWIAVGHWRHVNGEHLAMSADELRALGGRLEGLIGEAFAALEQAHHARPEKRPGRDRRSESGGRASS